MWNYHIVLFDLNSVISDVLYNGPSSLALAICIPTDGIFVLALLEKKPCFSL